MKKLMLFLLLTLSAVLILVACGSGQQSITSETMSQGIPTGPITSSSLGNETSSRSSITTALPVTTTTTPATTPAVTTPETTVSMTTLAETTAAPMTYTASNWMAALPDNTMLNNIAMPGTHDSGAMFDANVFGTVIEGTAKCQSLTISEQLAVGVRYFDIRLRRVNGELHVYHGEIDQQLTLEAVLTACYTFLEENKSETLIMCIKEEANAIGTNDAFDVMVKRHVDANADTWFTGAGISQLDSVRGKIVLMRRYGTSGTFGFNASSSWLDNTTFTMVTGACKLSVQDYYQNNSAEDKWESVEAFFAKMTATSNTYYLNNTSGYQPGALSIPNINTIADGVNPKLMDYLGTNPDIVGIVATDFMTAEMAGLIYELNFS